ncbi:hypothetical protein CSUI_005366, partial [Cystoisospora suis]
TLCQRSPFSQETSRFLLHWRCDAGLVLKCPVWKEVPCVNGSPSDQFSWGLRTAFETHRQQ